jgi:hypothetical protein
MSKLSSTNHPNASSDRKIKTKVVVGAQAPLPNGLSKEERGKNNFNRRRHTCVLLDSSFNDTPYNPISFTIANVNDIKTRSR